MVLELLKLKKQKKKVDLTIKYSFCSSDKHLIQ